MSELPVLNAKCITLLELLVTLHTNINLLLPYYYQFLHLSHSWFPYWRKSLYIKIEGNESHHNKVVLALQDIFELVISDLMLNESRLDGWRISSHKILIFVVCLIILHGCRTMELLYAHLQSGEEVAELFSWIEPPLFASKHSIHFPLPDSGSLMEKVLQLTLLLISLTLVHASSYIWKVHLFFIHELPSY